MNFKSTLVLIPKDAHMLLLHCCSENHIWKPEITLSWKERGDIWVLNGIMGRVQESGDLDSRCGSRIPVWVDLGELINFSEPPIPHIHNRKNNKHFAEFFKDSNMMTDMNIFYKSKSAMCPKDEPAVIGVACLPACQF